MFDNNSNPQGAYNLLCNPPPNPFNGDKRDGVWHRTIRREEKVIGPSLTGAGVSDNCTEIHVAPTESWANYAPNKDFVTNHGHYTVRWTLKLPPRHPSRHLR